MEINTRYEVLSARDVGGCHLRERCWILATNTKKLQCNDCANNTEHSECKTSKFGNRVSQIDSTNSECIRYIQSEFAEKLQNKSSWNDAPSERGRQRISSEIEPASTFNATDNRSERVQRKRQGPVYQFNSFPWGEDVRSIEDLRNRPDLPKPLLRGSNDGVAFRVERTKAIGNGQNPRCAATAFEFLRAKLNNEHQKTH